MLAHCDEVTGDIAAASGLVAGAGYLARPEVILVPVALALTWCVGFLREPRPRNAYRLGTLVASLLCALAVVGSYAAVKGEISEKLAVRLTAKLRSTHEAPRRPPQQLPRGLDDPRWDFSPKEEGERIPIHGAGNAVGRIIGKWWEELCWVFAVMTVWGLVRQRYIRGLCPDRDQEDSAAIERRLVVIFAAVYVLALVRHSVLLGYLSGRHIMALVYVSLPWAAAGCFVCARGIAVKLRWSDDVRLRAAILAGGIIVAASIVVQMQPSHLNHLSRSGHWAAGRWLAEHAGSGELVLDTRGWAKFVSGHPGYDYWHVRQALTDSHLAYIVVGLDELHAHEHPCQNARSPAHVLGDARRRFPGIPGRHDACCPALSLPSATDLGRTQSVSFGSLKTRWIHGVNWTWINESYRATPREHRRDRHEPREPRSLSREARPLHGPRGSARSRSAAAGLFEATLSIALARALGRALAPRRPAFARPRPSGCASSACATWESTFPKSSPPASASARVPACRAS